MDIGPWIAVGISGGGLFFAGAQVAITALKTKVVNNMNLGESERGGHVTTVLCNEKMKNVENLIRGSIETFDRRFDSLDNKIDILISKNSK